MFLTPTNIAFTFVVTVSDKSRYRSLTEPKKIASGMPDSMLTKSNPQRMRPAKTLTTPEKNGSGLCRV
jgi:hypothetical protein